MNTESWRWPRLRCIYTYIFPGFGTDSLYFKEGRQRRNVSLVVIAIILGNLRDIWIKQLLCLTKKSHCYLNTQCVSWALLCIYVVNPVACRKCHLQLCIPASLPPSPCRSILLSWLNEQVSAWILPKGRIFWQGGLLKELYVQLWVFVVFMKRGKLLYPFLSIFPLPCLYSCCFSV